MKEYRLVDRGDILLCIDGKWTSPYCCKPQVIDKHILVAGGLHYSHFDTVHDEMVFLRFPYYLKESWRYRYPLAAKRWDWWKWLVKHLKEFPKDG